MYITIHLDLLTWIIEYRTQNCSRKIETCQQHKCGIYSQQGGGGDEEMVEKKGGDTCLLGATSADSRVTAWPLSRMTQSQVWSPGPRVMRDMMQWSPLSGPRGHHHLRSRMMRDLREVRVEWRISNWRKKCDGRSDTGSRVRVSLPGPGAELSRELRGSDYEYCINRGLFIPDRGYVDTERGERWGGGGWAIMIFRRGGDKWRRRNVPRFIIFKYIVTNSLLRPDRMSGDNGGPSITHNERHRSSAQILGNEATDVL